MSASLLILGCGAITAAGRTAPQTAAAIRAALTGFADTEFFQDEEDADPHPGAPAPLKRTPAQDRLFRRLVSLLSRAVREALAAAGGAAGQVPPQRIPLLVGVREPFRDIPDLDGIESRLVPAVERKLGVRFHPDSKVFPDGNAAAFLCLARARELIQSAAADRCVVSGVDSFLNNDDLTRFEDTYRLKREGVAQGFIPGEGAAAVVVAGASPGQGVRAEAEILGVGLADEDPNYTVLSDNHPVGKGLERAMRAAVADAAVPESVVEFRVSDVNGEYYRGMESMLALSRFYRSKREVLKIWLPAASVGETGAAAGPMLLAFASAALNKGYAQGRVGMCEASSDGGLRGTSLITLPRDESIRRSPADRVALPKAPGKPVRQPRLVRTITMQHADGATFLWTLRGVALTQPNHTLDTLAELEERVEAHLDALRVAGEAGWALLQEHLGWKDAGDFFVAALLATEGGGGADRLRALVEKAAGVPGAARGIASALGWQPWDRVGYHVKALLAEKASAARLVGIAASAIHRKDPGPALRDAARDPDPVLRARALKVFAELGRTDAMLILRGAMEDPDEDVRFAAARAAAVLGVPGAGAVLRSIAEMTSQPRRDAAAMLAARADDPGAVLAWHKSLAASPRTARTAVVVAGAFGDAALVPWLLERMPQLPLSRAAGEAMSLITGVDLGAAKLTAPAPEGFDSGPNEDPEDTDVAMDPDDHLPWPDVKRLARWWEGRKGEFPGGRRYFLGKAADVVWLADVLRTGNLRHRAVAAFELARLQPGQPMFEVRGPAARQRKSLGL